MPIVIYGVGSSIVADVAETCVRLNLSVAAWVRNVDGPVYVPDGMIVTTVEDLSSDILSYPFVVPQFTPAHRHRAYKDAQSRGFANPAALIDPTAVIASSTEVAPGSYVNSLANIGGASRIGAFAFINRGASIGHHVEFAEFVSIGPAAILAAGVRIHAGAVIGAGAIVLPGVEIGTNAVVGAGANVTRSVPAHSLVTGNPAKVSKYDIPGYHGYGVALE
jgi:hypothetical protein